MTSGFQEENKRELLFFCLIAVDSLEKKTGKETTVKIIDVSCFVFFF